MPYQPWQNPYLPNSQYQPNYMTAGGTYQMMQQPVNGIIKVNGPQSAMQVQLPPNSTSQPMFDASFDGKNGTFYVVSTDGTGTKSIEVFDFTPHVDQTVQVDGARFVSREEFDEFTAKVSAAIGAINGSNAAVSAASTEQSDAQQAPKHSADDGR